MSKKIYAKAPETVSVGYLTPGRMYEVTGQPGSERSFSIVADSGSALFCLWKECAHLDGGDWERVEVDTDAE